MRKNLVSLGITAVFALGAVATTAVAAPLLVNGPIGIKFNNVEQISSTNSITAPGGGIDPDGAGPLATLSGSEGNWGVFNVTNLQVGNAPITHNNTTTSNFSLSGANDFWTSANGGEFTGIFFGLQVDGSYAPVPGGYQAAALGGYLDLYYDPSNDYSTAAGAAGRTAQDQYTSATNGEFLVRIAFATGEVQGNNTNTVFSSIALTSLGANFTGQAFSYGNVVDKNGDGTINALDGTWAAQLNQDWFNVDTDGDTFYGGPGETRDIRFQNNFNNYPDTSWDGANGIRGAESFDPVKAFAVPEPATLVLMGVGLVAAGMGRRRKAA